MNTFDIRFVRTKYKGCSFHTARYSEGGNLYIGITRKGEPIADVTVNIGALPPGQIAVKNYSENAGLLEQLEQLGLVEEVVRYVPSGFVQIPICKYNEEVLAQYCANQG